VQRSTVGKPVPDLFCYAVLADFRGYQPGYSERIRKRHDCLTWVVLKGHTNNRAGSVTLASPDPRVRPRIDFRYFEEGTDASGDDLRSVVEGVKLARRMTAGMKPELVAEEELPGDKVNGDAELAQFVRDHAWGHHASCTCAIGPEASGGVLTRDFKVHRTEGLRVVDASAFPRAPGLFIVSAVYMIAEKAADVIVAEAKRGKPMP
jgi:choline dehydrogenase-like flavoprotein